MNAANTTVILFTPFHITNNSLLFFLQLCFLHFCIWLPHKPESLFTESDTITAVANTPITMLHIGQIILVYYTTNHLILQSKNATLTGAINVNRFRTFVAKKNLIYLFTYKTIFLPGNIPFYLN